MSIEIGAYVFRSYQHVIDWLDTGGHGTKTFLDRHCKKVGKGGTRTVYRVPGRNVVIKKYHWLNNDPSFKRGPNWSEFRAWNRAARKHRVYLARARAISYKGNYLVMDYMPGRLGSRKDVELLRKKLPRRRTVDLWYFNIKKTRRGWPKAVDYAW